MTNIHDGIERKLGELDGKMDMVLKMLEEMKRNFDDVKDQTIRNEKDIQGLKEVVGEHLENHEKEASRKIYIIAIIISAFASALFTKLFTLI